MVLLVACGQQSQQATSSGPTATVVPKGSYVNPVLATDFPDPRVLQDGNTYYAYGTNAAGKNVQVVRSTDLVHWDALPDALPALPTWANPGGSHVWAAQAIHIGNKYVMYYVARDQQSDKQCVGIATSDKPEGRFKDTSSHALVCQTDEGGTIDPRPFNDGRALYLYFKNDGNCCGITTYLYAQPLTPDGLSLTGKPTRLVNNDQSWEGNVVEAPEMFKHDGKYYLFFSANSYAGVNYAVGYATCKTVIGPCTDASNNPILKSKVDKQPFVIGPGGESVLQIGSQTWIFYHAWNTNPDGSQGDSRFMWLDRINWNNDAPTVQGPTTSPELMPIVNS